MGCNGAGGGGDGSSSSSGGKYMQVIVVDEGGKYRVIGDISDEGWKQWYLHSFPSGFRFNPRDDELIEDYLIPKLKGEELPINTFKDVNIYAYSPARLTAMIQLDERDAKEWYFFTPRERKYPNGERPDRAAGEGYWKATGADKPIEKLNTDIIIGYRKSLVYYEGKANSKEAIKTNWIMHEFRTIDPSRKPSREGNGHKPDMRLDDCILVRIYEKADRAPKRRKIATGQEINEELQSGVSPKSDVSEEEQEEMVDEDSRLSEILVKEMDGKPNEVKTNDMGKSIAVEIKNEEARIGNMDHHFTNTTLQQQQQQQPLPETMQNQPNVGMLPQPYPLNWNSMFLEQQQFGSYTGSGFHFGDMGGSLDGIPDLQHGDDAFNSSFMMDELAWDVLESIQDPETEESEFYTLDCPPSLSSEFPPIPPSLRPPSLPPLPPPSLQPPSLPSLPPPS